jgi:predicted alpha-1,2-mannosidase
MKPRHLAPCMRAYSLLFHGVICFASISAFAQTPAVDWVNESIGTANEGQTFPSTAPPFAMTQWTPQTRAGNVKCVAPYYFGDAKIQGFRGSHFLSGSCTKDYGSLTLMPESGALKLGPDERGSAFSRSREKAQPQRYAVTLSDYGIDAELTGTLRAGIMRFRFNRADQAWILVESNSEKGDGNIRIDAQSNEITVVNPVRRLYAGAGKLAGFNGYFVVQFDHKFHVGGTWSGEQKQAGAVSQEGVNGTPGAYVSFDLKPGETVSAKVGSSFTSLEEARRNLRTEIPGWDFAQVVERTKSEWNQALSKVEIEAAAPQKRVFYTALYHSMQVPRVFSDVDGSYPGFANEGRIETAKGFTYYCDFSLWDTFRALHPLLTILEPERELDMVKSLIVKGEEGGFLPIYPAWNSYTSEMVGDHAGAVIADAYFKGIRGFDIEEAYRLMKQNATELPATQELYVDGRGRRGLTSYLKYGFIPLEDHLSDAFHQNEQVSRSLEYAYDDSVAGEVAEALGHSADAEMFRKRAQNYRNVIDPTTGFARGRHADGSWDSPFDPAKPYKYITEGLPFQYTFFVPQDLPGLIDLVGGRKAFIAKLDALFAGGYYDHGNEPSHHIAYLYDNAGAAWKTQQHVRDVMDKQYVDTPEGLAGNDDAGQMSAWYVLSALGFYPVTPGTPVYEIGTPLFDEAVIRLDTGKQFRIRAEGASAGKQYIRSVKLNGVALNRYWLKHSEIVAGGELVFEMSSEPSLKWPAE